MRRLKKEPDLYSIATLENKGNLVELVFSETFQNVENTLHKNLEKGFYEVVIKDNDQIDYTVTCFIDVHPELDDDDNAQCLCPIYYPRTGYPIENEMCDCFLPGFIYIVLNDPDHVIVMDMYKRADQDTIKINTSTDCLYYFYKLDI